MTYPKGCSLSRFKVSEASAITEAPNIRMRHWTVVVKAHCICGDYRVI